MSISKKPILSIIFLSAILLTFNQALATSTTCTNNLLSGSCYGNVTYTANTQLEGTINVSGSVVISNGITLSASKSSGVTSIAIIAGNEIINNGIISTFGVGSPITQIGACATQGSTGSGGSSLGGGGGGGGGANTAITNPSCSSGSNSGGPGGAGGSTTFSIGGAGGTSGNTIGNDGSDAATGSYSGTVSNNLIKTWFENGIDTSASTLIGASGGSGGSAFAFGGSGGAGGGGVYLQANTVYIGTIIANGQNGQGESQGDSGPGGGGGGGGAVIIAYNTLYSDSNIINSGGIGNTTGSPGSLDGSGVGGSGSAGYIDYYQFVTQPIPASIYLTISPSSASVYAGQKVQFTNVTKGAGGNAATYSYSTNNASLCAEQSGTNVVGFIATSIKSAQICYVTLYVSSSNGTASATAAITVYPDIKSTLSASSSTDHINQSETVSASVSGGTGTYTGYQWYIETPGNSTYLAGPANAICGSSAQTDACSFIPGNTFPMGIYSFEINVTGEKEYLVYNSTSSPIAVNVVGPSVSEPVPDYSTVPPGYPVTFNAMISYGVGPFVANLIASNGTVIATANAPRYGVVSFNTFNAPLSSGSYAYNVVAADEGMSPEYTFNSVSNSITVSNSIFAGPVTFSSNAVTYNSVPTLREQAFGGTEPYTYNFIISNSITGNIVYASGPLASNTLSYSLTPQNPLGAGTYSANVIVTDSSNAYSVSHNTEFSILKAPSLLTLNLPQNSIYSGQPSNVTFGIAPSDISSLKASLYANNALIANSVIPGQFGISKTIGTGYSSSHPYGIAFSPNGKYAYVALYGGYNKYYSYDYGNVTVISTSNGSVVRRIGYNSFKFYYPLGIAVSANGSYLYVANYEGFNNESGTCSSSCYYGNVTVINASTGVVVHNIEAKGIEYPSYDAPLLLSPNGANLYVPDYYGNVSVINTSTFSVENTITYANNGLIYGMATSPNGSKLYISDYDSGNVYVVNTSAFKLSNTISLGTHLGGIAISKNGSVLYVASFSNGNIMQINTSTDTRIPNSNISTGARDVYTLSLSRNGTYLYGTSYNDSNVFVINSISGNFVGNVTGFDKPYAMAYSPTGNYLYVGNYDNGTIADVSTISNPVFSAYSAGTYNVMLETNGNENYSSNTISGSFSILPANLTLNTTLQHSYTYNGKQIQFNYTLADAGFKPINTTISLNGNYLSNWLVAGIGFLKNITKIEAYIEGYGASPYTFSRNGKNVYVTTYSDNIPIFNTSTGIFIGNISSNTLDYPAQTAVSSSGATLYSLSYYGNLSIVNVSTGNIINVIYGNTLKDGNTGRFISLSNNGEYAYIGSYKNFSIFNLSSGKLSSTLGNSLYNGYDSGVALNPLNNYIYLTNYTKLEILNVSNPETPKVTVSPVSFYEIYSNPVVSANGTVVYVPVYYGKNAYYDGGYDGNITAVSAYTGNYLGAYVGYFPYGSQAISKNGKYLFSPNDDRYILITNFSFPATEYFVLIDLKGSEGLAISPSGKYLYAYNASGNTSIYYISPVGEYLLNGSAGNYKLKFSASSSLVNHNYTHNYTFFSVNIMKATPALSLTLPQNDVYNGNGKAIDFSVSSIYNQTKAQLYVNGNDVANTFTSGSYNISAIGNYSVELLTNGNANYTASNTSANILIRDMPESELIFPSNTTYTGSNMIITWGIGTTGNVVNATLYMDGNAVATGNTMGLKYDAPADIGNYSFRVVSNLTSEYFGISLSKTLSVTAPQNSTTTTIGGVVNSPGGGFGIPGGTQTTTIPIPKNISNATLSENINLLPFSTELINYSDGEFLLYIKSDLNLTTLHTVNIHLPKYISLPKAPSGFTLIYALNYSISGINNTAVKVTMRYNCSLSPALIYPYIIVNNSWIPISNFTLDSSACTISFGSPQDPTAALLYKNTTVTTTPPATNTTSSVTTTIPANVTRVTTSSNVTSAPQPTQTDDAAYYIAVVVIIVIVAIIAYFVRNGKKK